MIDLPLSLWFHSNRHPLLTQFMLFITQWHSTAGILLMAAAIGVGLYFSGRSWWLLSLLLTVPGGMLLNVGVKHLVQRARPHFDDPVMAPLTTYSFPSGHTAGATLLYGFLAVYLLARQPSRPRRVAIVAAAVLMVSLVAVSRMYLGQHYFTDVAAAMVEGVLWLALCLAGVRALRRRSRQGVA